MNIAERLKKEWKQMTFWHKTRLTISLNLMVAYTLASGYATSWKLISGLLSLHYGTTILYAGNETMIVSLNNWYNNGMMVTMFYDLITYFAVMFILAFIGIKNRIFGDTRILSDVESKEGKPQGTEERMEEIVSHDAEDVHETIDVLLKRKV